MPGAHIIAGERSCKVCHPYFITVSQPFFGKGLAHFEQRKAEHIFARNADYHREIGGNGFHFKVFFGDYPKYCNSCTTFNIVEKVGEMVIKGVRRVKK